MDNSYSGERLAATAYTLGRAHTCFKCEHSNIPCGFYEGPEPTSPSVGIGLAPHVRIALLEKQCARSLADAERLAKENRELKEQLIQAGLRSKPYRGVHGS